MSVLNKFLKKYIDYVTIDNKIVGTILSGPAIEKRLEADTVLELIVIIEDNSYYKIIYERNKFASRFGNIISYYDDYNDTNDTNDTNEFVCIYEKDLLQVTFKFVNASIILNKLFVGEIIYDKNNNLSDKLNITKKKNISLSIQWYENRFWILLNYGITKLNSNQLMEAIEYISFIRQSIITPMIHMKLNQQQRDSDYLEFDAPEFIDKLKLTVSLYDKSLISKAYEELVIFYIELRKLFDFDYFSRNSNLEEKVLEKLIKINSQL